MLFLLLLSGYLTWSCPCVSVTADKFFLSVTVFARFVGAGAGRNEAVREQIAECLSVAEFSL